MMDHDPRAAEDAREQLRRWDGGGTIWSIEMGGLGPGYEQAIQVLAIEIMRDYLDKPLPEKGKPFGSWGDDTVRRVDVQLPDGSYSCGGFSGAQVGAAKALAAAFLEYGPAAAMEQVKDADRRIQVSPFWPRVGSAV